VIDPDRLVYLDESGVSTQMTRSHGRAARGLRGHAAVPGGHWKVLTILGALSCTGMLTSMTVEAATDGEVFLDFLDALLCPSLRPGDVLVMDNLNVRKVDGVRQRVEAVGARLLYPPPYSPTSIPLKKPGPSSSNCSVEKTHAPRKPSIKQSQEPSPPSQHMTQKHRSD